jgi:hypothetical protein
MTMRRFVKDESGMTLGLAMMMIVLIGVMGAGLLTFASKDLGSVLEVNRGQRAFEVADAGIGVAKRQITSDCGAGGSGINCTDHYDDLPPSAPEPCCGAEDIQWSPIKGGVTLNDLDGDGNVTTSDNVTVTIRYSHTNDHFKVISEGTYTTGNGLARRKIEVILVGVGGALGGQGIGHPVYYTPSDITIEGNPAAGDIQVTGISMFTQQDIVIEGLASTCLPSTPTCEPEGRAFKTEYENSGSTGIFSLSPVDDELEDWNTLAWGAGKPQGSWNTEPRMGHSGDEIGDYPNNRGCARDDRSCESPGFAAEGKICGVPVNSGVGNCDGRTSIADGVYAYDCTTGPVVVAGCTQDSTRGEVSRGNDLTFVEKQPDPVTGEYLENPEGTLSYPFPQLQPNDKRLKRTAQEQQSEGTGGYYYRGCDPPWETIWNRDGVQNDRDVIFIDAGDCDAPIEMEYSGNQDGILVVWCGDLHHTNNTMFRGILMNLIGNGEDFGSSNCEGDMSKGVYRVDEGSEMWGWLYAEGGTDTRSGIEISSFGTPANSNQNPGWTTLHFRSGASWNFLDDAFSTPSTPTGFSVVSWRELYE